MKRARHPLVDEILDRFAGAPTLPRQAIVYFRGLIRTKHADDAWLALSLAATSARFARAGMKRAAGQMLELMRVVLPGLVHPASADGLETPRASAERRPTSPTPLGENPTSGVSARRPTK